MKVYADRYFYLHATPEGQTVSRYDQLKQVEKTLGAEPNSMVKVSDLPESAYNAWRVFCELISNVGSENITYSELAAYCALTGDELMNWEIKAIMTIKHSRLCLGANNGD